MLDLIIFLLFLLAVLWLGLLGARRRREGLADYVLAGRTLTLPMFVATLVPTFYGGVLGIGEFTWSHGLVNWLVMALPYYVFAALYASFLAGRVRLEPGLTLPDHFEGAYGRPAALLAAGLVFLLACPADEMLMLGTLLSHVSGLGQNACMALGGTLALGLLLKGGLRSDVWSNRLEFLFMFGGFFVVLPFAAMKLGGPSFLERGLPEAHLTLTGGLKPLEILGWWLIAVWTLVDPAFHQRCAAAESPRTARRGIWVAIGFWALFDLMTTSAGLYARAALPSLDKPLLAFPLLAEQVLPPAARGLFFAGLASSLLAALQATGLLSAVSLGKDGLGRLAGLGERAQELGTRGALVVTGLVAWSLAYALPSVVGLWYAIGSAVLPGLLLPLLGVYFPSLRVGPRWAFSASLGGWSTSTAWLLWSQVRGSPPLGIEPMFPGLAASGAAWGAGLWARERAA